MADANAESIQQKIQIARRDAEALKDRIKRKKDELADTTCEYMPLLFSFIYIAQE
jgi:guanine nucleotide-binding protein G(I)/G(S)/G(T) subunit beta-1